MKRTQSAASIRATTNKTIQALFISNLRTNGSRMRLKDMKVYSEKPMRARIGSSMYCWDARR